MLFCTHSHVIKLVHKRLSPHSGLRAPLAHRAVREARGRIEGDWVDEVCTWTRFERGLQKTTTQKGVGVDGFNAYLLRKAPEDMRCAYWEALKECIREKKWPEEWGERMAMLEMKPGEDPIDLSR